MLRKQKQMQMKDNWVIKMLAQKDFATLSEEMYAL